MKYVLAKREHLNCRVRVEHNGRILPIENRLDLAPHQGPYIVRARSCIPAALPDTSGRVARRGVQRETPPVKAQAQYELVGLDTRPPEEIDRRVYLGQIRMCGNNGADPGVVLIPGTVQVIRHEVDPVDVLQHAGQVEVLQVPEGGGRGECKAIREFLEVGVEELHQCNVIFLVCGFSTAVICDGVFPVDIDALST